MLPPDEGRQVKRPGMMSVSWQRKKYGANDMDLSIIVEQSLCRTQRLCRHFFFIYKFKAVEK
jgi:hypothetical protein